MEKKDILCPDCETNYISNKRFSDFGKCISCYRREIMAKTNNNPYIKVKDLSDEEKVRLARAREVHRKSAKKIRTNNNTKNQTKKVVKDDDTQVNNRGRNQIYTPEIIEQIKLIANENITPAELLEMIQSLFPDKPFTSSNLNNVLVRNNIPHSSRRGRKPIDKTEIIDTNTEEIAIEEEPIYEVQELPNIDEPIIEEPKQEEIFTAIVPQNGLSYNPNFSTIDRSNDKTYSEDEPARFGPIRDEIDGVLATKFRRQNCSLPKDYDTNDYVNMLEMLLYIKENSATIIKNRRSQQNIMNAYQSDMLHEMENAVAKDGDTYLSDKMHIIRKYRRHYECDYKDVATLRPLIESIDLDTLKKVLNNMKKNQTFVEQPVFKPMVDTTLIDKYEWAQPIDPNSAKAKIAVGSYNPNAFTQNNGTNERPVTRIGMTPNTPPTNQLTARVRKSIKRFRVSCKVSGGGYGVFKDWYRDYECTNKDTAMAYAKNTLNQLSQNRKGMIWTDLDVVELNVDGIGKNASAINK